MVWLSSIVGLYLVWVAALSLGQGQVIFPGQSMALPRGVPPADVHRWTMLLDSTDASSGELFAWYMPARRGEGPRPAVIFAHGNAALAEHNLDLAELYAEAGMHVLVPEYRGYAESPGRPSERRVRHDFARWYDRLIAREEVDASRVVFHGRSIGGGVVGALARVRSPAAMILESTFTSIARLSWRYAVPHWLIRSQFRTVDVVGQLEVPILVLHGTGDRVIPARHADALAAAGSETTLLTRHSRHHDLMSDAGWYRSALLGFASELGWIEDTVGHLEVPVARKSEP
ncbi:MAG: alpha/beta hydrolase [Planctomycetota bacterium]